MAQLLKNNKELEKKLATAKHALITGEAAGQEDNVQVVAGVKVLASRVDGVDARRRCVRRSIASRTSCRTPIVVMGSVENGKVRLAAGVTKNNTDRVRAGDLVNFVAEQVGGKGRRPARLRAGRRHQSGRAGCRVGVGSGMGF